MSIEAQALSALITSTEAALLLTGDKRIRAIADAVKQAKYWVQPMQTFRDQLYSVWEDNKHWTRPEFVAHCSDEMQVNNWSVNCICIGDMNYRVENEGFIGWLKAEGHATDDDFEVIIDLCRSLKTPVGYKIAAIISSVQVFVKRYRDWGTQEKFTELEEDLEILTHEYQALRYQFIEEVERKLRQDVPVFQ